MITFEKTSHYMTQRIFMDGEMVGTAFRYNPSSTWEAWSQLDKAEIHLYNQPSRETAAKRLVAAMKGAKVL